MKKVLKKLMVSLLSAAMLLGIVSVPAKAAEEDAYDLFIAFGGDKAESNDWGYSYAGPATEGNTAEVEAVTEQIKVGETRTVSLTLPSECVYTWYIAPVLVAEGASNVDATVTVKVDGQDVDIDAAAGDAFWYEETGSYTKDQAIRLAGGYNEWGTHYIESPVFTTIEYTVTLNDITFGGADLGELTESTEEYRAFLAFGGDKAAENDWGFAYDGGDAAEGITATEATIKSGETATVSLEFAEPVFYTWYCAPVIVAEGVGAADFSVKCFIDDVETELDMTAGDNWWYEATGAFDETQAVRVAGGYNEWGAKYIPESPKGFKKIAFEITANSIQVGGGEAAPKTASGTVDKNGTYNAYIGFQTPLYSFRNAFDDATYGRDTDYFSQVTGWEGSDAIVCDGTFTDAVIAGNGTYTVSVDGMNFPDTEFKDQEYMNLIFLSTDIPNTGDIEISDVVLKVDGKSVDLASAGAIISPDSVEYLCIMLQNVWNDDVKEIGFYNVPPKSMSITFNVSGFDYDAEAPAEEAAPAETEVAAPAEEASSVNVGLIVGIVAAVVVVAGVIVFAVVRGKKKNK